jgi:hypothetical protein
MFIPRIPVIENQFCAYAAQITDATGVGGVLCYAGSVLKLNSGATNEEAIVSKMVYGNDTAGLPFGFAMQKVKTGYHSVHPAGFVMNGDLGSSDVIAQPSYSAGAINGTKEAPLGVAHLGIWDTVHYTTTMVASVPTVKLSPSDDLYAANDQAKVTRNVTPAANADDLTTGECVNTTVVAKVVKGASLAKCIANIANTTLYPIRIKLLI